MPLWLLILTNYLPTPPAGRVEWHGHEMIFGFTLAVIAGFLLTAVQNWTGKPTVTGWPLAALSASWLAGRIAFFIPGAVSIAACFDSLFFAGLFIALARPLVSAQNQRNYFVLLILCLFGLLNSAWYLSVLTRATPWTTLWIQQLSLELAAVLIIVIGGRVIPFFTRRAIDGASPSKRAWLEWLAVPSFLLAAFCEHLAGPSVLSGTVAFGAAALHGTRLVGWWHPQVCRHPLLWVLHLAYGWIIIALLLRGAGAWELLNAPQIWIHALTVGAIGTMCYGMIGRVSLGHTGRPLRAPRLIVIGYILLNLSALARCLVPFVPTSGYTTALHLSAGLWMFAFAAAVFALAPILLRSRVDGRPG